MDIDNLSTNLLKSVAFEIAAPLAFIFNLSLTTGVVPKKLKTSRTVPIFKSDIPTNLTNYRPISCLPILSKIIEKIVANSLSNFLTENNLINEHQYGFQANKSTVHPLLHVVNFISNAFNNDEIAVAIFLDLSKAFDLVDHKILIMKLNKLGIRGSRLKWFSNYLKDRIQYVMVNGNLSEFYRILNFGVPQGSILGPLLFLVFINDIFHCNNLFNLLFADDTTGLAKGKNIHDLVDFVNPELQKLAIWLKSNKLAVNASKTKIMIFHPKGKIIPNINFVFNNNDLDVPESPDLIHPIERITNQSKVPAIKLLGVYLDENLTFDYHFKCLHTKLSKSLYSINRVKHILPKSALKTLYYSLIHPHFIYCLPIIGCTSQKNINLLNKSQKWAIRIINKAKYNSHTQPLFACSNILPFSDLILQQNLHIIHAFIFNYLPSSFSNLLQRNHEAQTHNYSFRNVNEFFVPQVKNEFLKRFPPYAFPVAWNTLPVHLKNIPNKNMFRINLKNHLMSPYKSFTCNRLFCYVCSINQ